MNLERLISSIVRQTTLLIARISTAGGVRSPLSRVADQVFVGIVEELERQGVGKKVVADMFGMALRSYQLKLQRLQESASEGGKTLWAAVRSYVEDHGPLTRDDIFKRFARDDEASVGGILNDLVESGLVFRAGRGGGAIFRATTREDFQSLLHGDSNDARDALVWLVVCRQAPLSRDAIVAETGLRSAEVDAALETLLSDGRVQRAASAEGDTFSADKCLIPLGDDAGFEAALLDHHQAVLNALAAKIGSGARRSAAADVTGGSTFSFELWRGHPHEEAVQGLLARVRGDVASVWNQTSTYNESARSGERRTYNVTFYLGQYLRGDEEQET
jgi:hypothetical protein